MKEKNISTLLLTTFILGTLILWPRNKWNEPEKNKETTNNTQKPPYDEQQPLRTPESNQQKWNAEERRHRCIERIYWLATIVLTAGAVIGASASAWFAWGALGASQQAVKAARDAVKEAEKQTKAAIDSNDINREAFTSVQRAFVTLSEIRIEMQEGLISNGVGNPGIKAQLWMFTPIIENSGSTPTEYLQYTALASCAPGMMLGPRQGAHCLEGAPPPGDPADVNIAPGKYPLGPHAKIPIGGAGVLPAFLQQIATTGFKWYIYGSIKYRDVFRKTDPHVTKYCFQINGSRGEDMKPRYGLCDHWNCTDDECKSDREDWDKEVLEGKIPPFQVPPPAFVPIPPPAPPQPYTGFAPNG